MAWASIPFPLLLATLLAAQAPRAPLLGSVVDPGGVPVAGAMVEAWRIHGQGWDCLDPAFADEATRIARAPTDKLGRFALQVPIGLPCELRVDHPPHARWIRGEVQPGENLRVVLEQPATLVGRVVQEGTKFGTPALLRAWDGEGTEVFRGRTDDEGNFRFARLTAGLISIEVQPAAAAAPKVLKLELSAGWTTRWTFKVAPGAVLRGRVTDAQAGTPIAGAVIAESWIGTPFKPVTTDADGRYQLRGFGSPGYREVICTAAGYVTAQLQREERPADPTVLDFALERGLAAAGRIVDSDGEPVADVYVALIGMVTRDRTRFCSWVPGRTDADGRFRLQGLRADLRGTLLIRCPGWATLVYSLPEAGADSVLAAGTIRLQRPRVVRGRAVDLDGRPVPRLQVCLTGTNGDREDRAAPSADGHSGWNSLQWYLGRRTVRTDDLGRFAFGDLAAGTFQLGAPGMFGATVVEVAANADPEPVEIAVPR